MKPSLILLIGFLFIACSSSNDLIEYSCYKDENRAIIATYTGAKGTIVGPSSQSCETLFTINEDSDDFTLYFSPCNLDATFEEDGVEVIFSGYLFETFETEDVCAFPFELTKIERVSQIQ